MRFIPDILLRGHDPISPEPPERCRKKPVNVVYRMAENPGHGIPDLSPTRSGNPPNVPSQRGPSPVRGRPLFESGDPYFEADEVLGEFASRAHLHQFFYTRPITPSLSVRYLLRAFGGYGIEIVHANFLS
jgi:hypothetical protein